MMERVKDKVAIITGGSGAFGKAEALTLAREGADVVFWDIVMEGAEITTEEIRKLGRNSVAMKVDITKSEEVNEAVKNIIREFGKIDILVNNAGFVSTQLTILDLSDEQWAKEIAVSLSGAFYCTRAVLRHMIDRRSGKIINISSLAGETGRILTSASYSAAKAGVLGFTMSVARSVAQYGINVNAVCPGTIVTEIHRAWTPEQLEANLADIPFNRGGVKGAHGKPEDVADAVLFLSSSESDYITGTRIRVNGGSLMG